MPTFIAVGDRDKGGYEGSRALAARVGDRVRLEVLPGQGHEYPPDVRAVIGDALAFIGTN